MPDEQTAKPDEKKLEEQIEEWMDGRPEDASTPPVEPASAPEISGDPGVTVAPAGGNEATPTEESSSLDDDRTKAAIDEISKTDSDTILATEDEKLAEATADKPKKPNVFKRWWGSKPWRYCTLTLIIALIIAALGVPTSRWWLFNEFGARADVTVTVLDGSTNLPLKDASVTLAGQTKITPKSGQIKFMNVELGNQQLTIEKPAFATMTSDFTVGFGSANSEKIPLKVVGIQYKFNLTDYLTGQPVAGAEVESGKASALSDSNGVAVLTLMNRPDKVDTVIKAVGYNQNKLIIDGHEHQTRVRLAPVGKDYFISKASGKYDVASVSLDGSSEKTVLRGTGKENGDIQLAANNDGGLLALVSIRDNKRGPDGYRLQALTVINSQTGTSQVLDHAKAVQLIGWVDGSTLVYVLNNSCGSQTCEKLITYNYLNGARNQLSSSGQFVSVLTIGNRIYYATSSDYQSDKKPELVAVNSDGTDSQVLLKNDIYNVYRSSYDELAIAALGSWYSYKSGDEQAVKVEPPSSPDDRHYVDSPDGRKSAWIDRRDGQPVLIIYDRTTRQDKVIASQPGLGYPLRWVSNNTLIYRVDTDNETADYALSLSRAKPVKIANVTDASGADGIHY